MVLRHGDGTQLKRAGFTAGYKIALSMASATTVNDLEPVTWAEALVLFPTILKARAEGYAFTEFNDADEFIGLDRDGKLVLVRGGLSWYWDESYEWWRGYNLRHNPHKV